METELKLTKKEMEDLEKDWCCQICGSNHLESKSGRWCDRCEDFFDENHECFENN